MQIANLVTAPLVIYQQKYPIINCLRCPIGCGAFAWFIAGFVLRFNEEVSYSCGDSVPRGVPEEVWLDEITSPDSLY